MKVRQARPGDEPGIARVHVDSWRTTYRGLVPDAYLRSLSYTRRQDMWEKAVAQLSIPGNPSALYVAENDRGEIVGFVSGGPTWPGDVQEGASAGVDLSKYDGEIYAIYILEDYQGHGIGTLLAEAAARRLAEAGMHSVVLWVLADNPATAFYEALGGRRLGSKEIEIGGAKLTEVAFGWQDILTIAGG